MTDLQEHFEDKKQDKIRTLEKTNLFNELGEGFFNIYIYILKHHPSHKKILGQAKKFKF